MIQNAELEYILTNATDISTVVEIYPGDTPPGPDGFDPIDADYCFAAVDGITFRGQEYLKYVRSFGTVKKSITKETNSASVTFDNTDRFISSLEFSESGYFEGRLLVIRILSRSMSTAITDTKIEFVGRCEKPTSGNSEAISVTAKFVLDSLGVMIPRRTYSERDYEGRDPADPEFEGFEYVQEYGTTTFTRKEKRGGLLGLFGLKKTVKYTMGYSGRSDLKENTPVPVVMGWMQILGTHIGHVDVGALIKMKTAFCEGPIEDFVNVRSIDRLLPLDATDYAEYRGLVGAANATNPAWVTPGNFSRTALIEARANNSAVDVTDPAPEIAAIVKGLVIDVPDPSGTWYDPGVATRNAAAHIRYLICGTDYYKMAESWVDSESFTETFYYNGEEIFNLSHSDFIFLD